MSHWMVILVLVVGAAVLGTGRVAGQTHRSLMDTLLTLEKSAMEKWRNGDPMRWVEISAPEVTYVDPVLTAPIIGLQAYTTYPEALKGKVSYQQSEFLNPKVAEFGNLAVLTYNYRSTSRNTDGTVTGQSLWNTTEVYLRSGDEWRIVHTHWSLINGRKKGAAATPGGLN